MTVEAQWERDKQDFGHWAIVTDAYRPISWCAECWERWPCQTYLDMRAENAVAPLDRPS